MLYCVPKRRDSSETDRVTSQGPHFCLFTLLSVAYLLLDIIECRRLRGSPGRLRRHPCGELPIPRIRPQKFGSGDAYWFRFSGKLLPAFANTVILGSGTSGNGGHIFLPLSNLTESWDSVLRSYGHESHGTRTENDCAGEGPQQL
jgi:hypothetical protein